MGSLLENPVHIVRFSDPHLSVRRGALHAWVSFALPLTQRLIARKMGFRNLLDVIPIKGTTIVKGSHGRVTTGDDAPSA